MTISAVTTGIDELMAGARPKLARARLGLIANPASVTPTLVHTVDELRAGGFDIRALFGPQHGARGEKQDNMIESASFVDSRLGIPVHSLYGAVRQPTPDMLRDLDAVLFDL
jgi:uncharacterized protein YbbC (DUF1343 family)